MSEMVEQVAKAIHDCMLTPETPPLAERGEVMARVYSEVARAAIAAMRDPAPEMIEDGRKKRFNGFASSTEEVWQAMIDRALK